MFDIAILTYYTKRCRVAKYVRMERTIPLRHHILTDPILICNPAIPTEMCFVTENTKSY